MKVLGSFHFNLYEVMFTQDESAWLDFNNPSLWGSQCSPYQAVTSKIYRLKQHFSYRLQPLEDLLKLNIELVFKNTQVVIRSDQGNV